MNTINKLPTAEKFAQDITPLLPFAFPELRRLGLMTTCAHCGKPLDDATFAVRSCTMPGEYTDVYILAICKACATSPENLLMNEWPHVCDTSGLFLQEHEWGTFAHLLRCHVITALHVKHGGLMLTTTDTRHE